MKVIDQMNRPVVLPKGMPQRIISLVPSQTELLYHLGLEKKVVGITEFCVRPEEWHQTKDHVGGTKLIIQKKINALNPDLIIGNKEENTPRDIQRLEKKYPVWMSDINTFEDALEMIEQVGVITNSEEKAGKLIEKIRDTLKKYSDNGPPVRIAYFIWKDPWMVVGNNTFIHDFAKTMGFENVFSDLERYPEISIGEIDTRKVDFVMLSSEPYAFSEGNFQDFENVISPSNIKLVDGQMFSWYGSHLVRGIQYLGDLKRQLIKDIHS